MQFNCLLTYVHKQIIFFKKRIKSVGIFVLCIRHGITIFEKSDGIRIWYCGTAIQPVYCSTLASGKFFVVLHHTELQMLGINGVVIKAITIKVFHSNIVLYNPVLCYLSCGIT